MNRTSYKHVVVVGIDGMGNYLTKTPTPNIDRIFENHAKTYHALSMSPTISAQNWCAMFFGCSPEVHSFTNSSVGRVKNTNEKVISVFDRVRKALPDIKITICGHWVGLINTLIDGVPDIDFRFNRGDDLVCDTAVEAAAEKPELMFVLLNNPDKLGHGTAWGSEEYLEGVTADDSYVGRIYEAYEKAGIIDDTLFVIITDHGGIRNGHGGYTDEEKYVFIAAAGKNVPKGEIGYAYTRDLSAIILYGLGLDVPPYEEGAFTSQVPDGIFPEVNGSYYKVQPKRFDREIRPTPAIDGENGLYKFIDKDRIRLAMFMDDTVEDATGKNIIESHNLVKYYSEGIYGSYGEFGMTGHVTVKDFKVGTGNFSFAFWAKVDRTIDEGVVVFANKNWFWRDRADNGIGFSFRASGTCMSLGVPGDQEEYEGGFPLDVDDNGWIHIAVAINKETKKYELYYNFKHSYTADIADDFLAAGDTDLPFTIGNDGLGTFSNEKYELLLNMDDFIFFGDAINQEDVSKLAEYYDYK